MLLRGRRQYGRFGRVLACSLDLDLGATMDEPQDPAATNHEDVFVRDAQTSDGEKPSIRADERDTGAATCDWEAGKRDMAANLQWWVSHERGGPAPAARPAAQHARAHARADTAQPAQDRGSSSKDDDPRHGDDQGAG